MDVCYRFYRFDLNYHKVFNDEIKTIADIELYTVVLEWQSDLG